MVKNTKGGSGHKSQSARENPRVAKNRRLADAWIEDAGNKFPEDTFLGRVTKRFGSGRYELMAQGPNKQIIPVMQAALRGSMMGGKGKNATFVEVGSVVLIQDTGLGGMPQEIVGMFTADHIKQLKKIPEIDERFFASPEGSGEEMDDVVEFSNEEDEEVDVDAI